MFEWDESKNKLNKKKHKISFEEAKTVFYDEDALVIDDPGGITFYYFKTQSESSGIPYQTLINPYLADCAANTKKLQLSWI